MLEFGVIFLSFFSSQKEDSAAVMQSQSYLLVYLLDNKDHTHHYRSIKTKNKTKVEFILWCLH